MQQTVTREEELIVVGALKCELEKLRLFAEAYKLDTKLDTDLKIVKRQMQDSGFRESLLKGRLLDKHGKALLLRISAEYEAQMIIFEDYIKRKYAGI